MRMLRPILILLSVAVCGCNIKDFKQVDLGVDDLDPSPALSTLTVSPQTAADGVSFATIKIVFRKASGNAIHGKRMRINVSGINNQISKCTSSDSNGISECTLKSTWAETKTVTAIGDFTMVQQAISIPPTASKQLFGSVVSGGNYQQAVSGQRLVASVGLPEYTHRN